MSQYAESRLEFHPWICNWIYRLRLEEMSPNDSDWIQELKNEKLIPNREAERSKPKENAEQDEQAREPKRKPS